MGLGSFGLLAGALLDYCGFVSCMGFSTLPRPKGILVVPNLGVPFWGPHYEGILVFGDIHIYIYI